MIGEIRLYPGISSWSLISTMNAENLHIVKSAILAPLKSRKAQLTYERAELHKVNEFSWKFLRNHILFLFSVIFNMHRIFKDSCHSNLLAEAKLLLTEV